ncbi:MAG: YebC/PmpR family DNA-binding transcriptional regulator [Cyanobacteria bacterium SIG30]|nr:YebC/PmpR family DNA-binding transcriptional regulator [Cyanobacteria bacterium SIG30]
MSGHSKWANIKHKKAKTDAAKGVSFAKFSREIIISAKMGGADPAANFRLRTAIDKAKAGGLPNDTIKRAIEKGAGAGSSDNFEEITYEGYGAGGVAVFVEAATDNRNRTAGDIRSYFTKFGGNLGETGCVGWIFEPAGVVYFDKSCNYDKLFEDGIEFDIKDIEDDEDRWKVITSVENFQLTVEGYEKLGYKILESDLVRIPSNSVEIKDVDTAKKVMLLLEKLEEHDDVQNVYSNFETDDEIMEKL